MNKQTILKSIKKLEGILVGLQILKGGAGSGNFNHPGRPGKVGGSGAGGGKPKPGSAGGGSAGGGSDNLDKNQDSEKWAKSLNEDEHFAFEYYAEYMPNYEQVSSYIAGRNSNPDADTVRAGEALKSALSRAPDYQGQVQRGMAFGTKNEWKQFKYMLDENNGEFQVRGLTSATKSEQVAAKYANPKHRGADVRVTMKMNVKSGVDVSSVNQTTSAQKEVILRKDTKYKVKTIKVEEDNSNIFSPKLNITMEVDEV